VAFAALPKQAAIMYLVAVCKACPDDQANAVTVKICSLEFQHNLSKAEQETGLEQSC